MENFLNVSRFKKKKGKLKSKATPYFSLCVPEKPTKLVLQSEQLNILLTFFSVQLT